MQKHVIVWNRADYCTKNFAEAFSRLGHDVSFDVDAIYSTFNGELCKRDSEASLKLKHLWDEHFKHGVQHA